MVSAIAQEDPRVRLLVRKGSAGSPALFSMAGGTPTPSILGVMDADLQHPPEAAAATACRHRRGRDLAIGSRYTPGGELGAMESGQEAALRRRRLGHLADPKRRLRAKIPCPGFFMVRRACIDGIVFQPPASSCCWRFWCAAASSRVAEVPFAFGRRSGGQQSQPQGRLGLCAAAGTALRGQIRLRARPEGLRLTAPATSSAAAEMPPTPAKNTSAMRMPGSRLTSGTRSVAAT